MSRSPCPTLSLFSLRVIGTGEETSPGYIEVRRRHRIRTSVSHPLRVRRGCEWRDAACAIPQFSASHRATRVFIDLACVTSRVIVAVHVAMSQRNRRIVGASLYVNRRALRAYEMRYIIVIITRNVTGPRVRTRTYPRSRECESRKRLRVRE